MAPLTQLTSTFSWYLAQQAQMSHLVFYEEFVWHCWRSVVNIFDFSNGIDGHLRKMHLTCMLNLSYIHLNQQRFLKCSILAS